MGAPRLLAAPLRRPARFLIPLLVAGVGGASLARVLPARYRATSVVRAEAEPTPGVSLEREILGRPRLEQLLAIVDPYPGMDERARIEALLRDLSVNAQGRDTFAIDYVHGDPQKAADLVNRLAALLTGSGSSPAGAAAPPDPLDARLAQARRELEDKEEGLRRYKQSRLGTLPEQKEALVATLTRLREESRELQATLLTARNRLSAFEGNAPRGARPEGRAVSPDLGRLQAELARLRTRYTDLHPDVQRLQSRIARLELQETTAGSAGTAAALADARAEVVTLEERQQDLDQRVAAFEARVEETSRTEQQLQALNRDLESLKKRHLALINQKMSARLVASAEPARPVTFRIVRATELPKRPISPNRERLLWAGLALGLLAGLFWSAVALPRPPETSSPQGFAAPEQGSIPTGASSVARAAREPAVEIERAPDPTEPQAQALAQVDETLVIPARPSGAAATSALEDLLEPGSVMLRPARPARASQAPADETVVIPRPDPETHAVDPDLSLLDPGSIFWAPVPRSITDTQPVPILEPSPEESIIWEEEQETAPAESATTIVLPLPEPLPLPVAAPSLLVDRPATPAVAPAPPLAVSQSVVAPSEPVAATPAPGPEPAADRGTPALVVAGGPANGTILPLPPSPSERLLGAAAYCHLRVDLPNVDPVHARIASDTFGLGLSDAGSSSGTYVNGRRIAGKYPLKDGDLVFLGPPGSPQSVGLLVHLPPPAARAQATTPAPATIRLDRAAPSLATRPLASPAEAEALALIPPPPPRAVAQPVLRPRVEVAAPTPTRGAATSGRRGRSLAIAAAVAAVAAGSLVASGLLPKSTPVVEQVTPAKARPGQTVTLTGSGFAAAPEANTVRLGDQVIAVISASEARLEIALPRELALGLPVELPLVVEAMGRRSQATRLTVVAAPNLERLEPPAARAGDVVTAFGRHLAGMPVTVHVAGAAAELLGIEPTALRFRVPATAAIADGSRAAVDVWAGGEQAERVFLAVGRLPLVTDVVPPRGNVGEQVTLRGFGFDPDAAGNRVHFGEREALVLAATATELVVSAPAAEPVLAGQSELAVLVVARGATSSSQAVFTLLGPPSGTFLPHFYAAPVPELPAQNHAFVATELGPLMLLTGPAGAVSTAARAAHAAGVLNELVEAAAKPLALVFKVEPAPSVMLAGGSYIVATATSTDALGYEGLWAKLGRRGEATPNSVATHWTALLQDYLALFVQHQRPTKVLELTSRGQLLADIHAQALKAAGGPRGVPTELLSRLRPQLADGLREMALLLSPPGQSNPGAAVVGRWRGTMEEGDRGAQPIQVRLYFEGKRLSGSLTRRSPRGVEGEIPLRSVDYEGGDLAFAVPVGESVLHFQGSVREDAMAGLIRGGESRQTMGFFTLSFVE